MEFILSDGSYIANAVYIDGKHKPPYRTKPCKLDCGAFVTCLSSTTISRLYGVPENKLIHVVKKSKTARTDFSGFNNNVSLLYFVELRHLMIDDTKWDRLIVAMKEITEADKVFANEHEMSTEKFLIGADLIQCCDGIVRKKDRIILNAEDTDEQVRYIQDYLTERDMSRNCFSIEELLPKT